MTTAMRGYRPKAGFDRVRLFLTDTYLSFAAPVNWGIERWNYARYFVAPMLGSYGTDDGSPEGALEAIRLWESLVGIWEANGEIVGAAMIEHPDESHPGYGEIFVQRHPERCDLLDEMMAYGERHFAHPATGRTHIFVYEDDHDLIDVVERRGYVRNDDRSASHLEYTIGELPERDLPEGFRIVTMAEQCDVDLRRELFGRSFNHEDSKEWPSRFAYEELMRAPDYKKDHDLVVLAPDGTYAACCLFWYDAVNRVGHIEPLGTRPEYRKLGLARELMMDAFRRLKHAGARVVPMTGGFDPFYEAIGFRKLRTSHAWERDPATASG
jgi:predicted N-acetyltransferase YhbS